MDEGSIPSSSTNKASLLREAFFVELPGIFSLFIMQHYMLLGQLHEKASYRASFFVFLERNDNSTESIILIFGKCILHFSQLHDKRHPIGPVFLWGEAGGNRSF